MKRGLAVFGCSFFILSFLMVRYLADSKIFETGIRLLLPVWVEDMKTDAFSSAVRIRYYNFIPVEELVKEKGAVVVQRFDDGRAAFVAKFSGQRLHPRELLLKYAVMPPSLFDSKQHGPNIRFASSVLRFPKEHTLLPAAVHYAVVYVNDKGNASLVGLTDAKGTQLVQGLTYLNPLHHTHRNPHDK